MSLSIITLAAYLAVGAVAGIIAGLLGLGGGIVIVPALFFIFIQLDFPEPVLMHLAVATSLATIIFTAISSTLAHHRKGAVLWPVVRLLVPGIVAGALLGAVIADYMPSEHMRMAFGIFELLVALQIGFEFRPDSARQLPGNSGMSLAGGVIGSLSTLLGIGGGTLTVPYLVWCNVNIRNAVAVSAACGLPIALAGCIGMVITGWDNAHLPPNSIGYVYWPAALCILLASVLTAPLGARLAHALPLATLKKTFAVVLAIIGLRMLI